MGQFSESDLKIWTIKRILGFFNRAQAVTDLTESILKDDPGTGTGKYAIGEVVARRILDRRNLLMGRRFVAIAQLNGIQGLGEDKFHDLVYTFRLPAADAFKESLFANVLADNWTVESHTINFASGDDFLAVVESDRIFRRWLIEEVGALSQMRMFHPFAIGEACERLHRSAMTAYPSGHLGAYALALWFYSFDQDNWFSFDEMLHETTLYLNFMPFMDERTELRMFHGFDNDGFLTEGLTISDLPVVVNYAETSVTVWSARLED
ncbi:MAG: hypothetical protein AAGN35_09945 [Bacteroidota bacterium]